MAPRACEPSWRNGRRRFATANLASIALVKSCGFVREGYSPRHLKIQGRWRDHERRRPWPPRNKYGCSASDVELGL